MSVNEVHSAKMSRRSVVKTALLGATLPAMGFVDIAGAVAPLAPLDPKDAQAKALGYVADSTKVDAKANVTYKPGQHCASCIQFQGKPADARGGCNIFPGKTVAANAWCKVWAMKPVK